GGGLPAIGHLRRREAGPRGRRRGLAQALRRRVAGYHRDVPDRPCRAWNVRPVARASTSPPPTRGARPCPARIAAASWWWGRGGAPGPGPSAGRAGGGGGGGGGAPPADRAPPPRREPLLPHESPTQIGVASQTLSLPAGKRVSVAILSGPRKGEAIMLVRPRLVLGRGGPAAGVDVAIDDPRLSPQHAALQGPGRRIVLRGLGSADGTFLGDDRIAGPRDVADGAEFRLGETAVLLLVKDP